MVAKQTGFVWDKSLTTNMVALAVVVLGLLLPAGSAVVLSIGLFALSGAVTNWLAVHMLFERVPLMYGSGVIPARFEEFKRAIKEMIMQQFFSSDNLKNFIAAEERSVAQWFRADQLVERLDYDSLFQRLVEAIMQTSFGSMLNMFGGASKLDGLKEPVVNQIKGALLDMVDSERFQKNLSGSIDVDKLGADMSQKIEAIVDQRLSELTPLMVKEIVQQMIRHHLGWLVVWGGVVGGLMGLIAGLLVQFKII